MGEIKIGRVVLGTIPRIVVIIDDFFPLDTIIRLKNNVDHILEIRIDCLKRPIAEIYRYLKSIKSNLPQPMIGTIRETVENQKERLSLFQSIIPFVDAIDIEIDTPIAESVIQSASGKTIIISNHNYKLTPDNTELNNIVTKAKTMGADIIKIAVMAKTKHDVTRLLTFTELCKENIVTIAMGEIGSLSRIVAPLFGSLFTYAFIDKPIAPGQLSLKKITEELTHYYPDFIFQETE